MASYVEAISYSPTARKVRLSPRTIDWYDSTTHQTSRPSRYVLGEGQNIIISPTPGSTENANIVRLRLFREVLPFTVAASYASSSGRDTYARIYASSSGGRQDPS